MELDSKLTEAEYRALPLESYSSLKYILSSPKDFIYFKSNPFKGSSASLLGTCAHHYLQGNRHLVVFKSESRKKKDVEEFQKFFEETKTEESVLVPASFQKTLEAIMTSYNNLPEKKRKLLDNSRFEVPLTAEYKGLKYKGKVDGLGDNYVIEIKTSSQATTAEEFSIEAEERHYDLQAYMYLHATNSTGHYFVVVNTTAPFKVDIYRTSARLIESGRQKLEKVVHDYDKYIINQETYEEDTFEEV